MKAIFAAALFLAISSSGMAEDTTKPTDVHIDNFKTFCGDAMLGVWSANDSIPAEAILWSSQDNIRHYRVCSVTDGTAKITRNDGEHFGLGGKACYDLRDVYKIAVEANAAEGASGFYCEITDNKPELSE